MKVTKTNRNADPRIGVPRSSQRRRNRGPNTENNEIENTSSELPKTPEAVNNGQDLQQLEPAIDHPVVAPIACSL